MRLQEMANQQQSFQTLTSKQLCSLNEVCQQLTGKVGSMFIAASAPAVAPLPAPTLKPDLTPWVS